MHSIAKATIIIPLIIILIAVVLRFSSTSYQSTIAPDSSTISVSLAPPTTVPSIQLQNKSAFPQQSIVKLNLKGPLACAYTDMDNDYKLFIQNRNIYAKIKNKEATNYFLVKGDCAYKWADKEKEGIKVCNVSQYLTLIETFASLPFFSPETLFSFIPSLQGGSPDQTAVGKNVMAMLVKNCMKQNFDTTLFEVPTTIQFIEQKITGSPQKILQK